MCLDKARFAQTFVKGIYESVDSPGDRLLRNPITGVAGCWGRAATGHSPLLRRAA